MRDLSFKSPFTSLTGFLALVLVGSAYADLVIVDSFDNGPTYFTWQPNQSGSQRRLIYRDVETEETRSRVELTNENTFRGTGAQRILIYTTSDNPFPGVGLTNDFSIYGNPNYPVGVVEGEWFLRHVAGGGAPANNMPIPNNGATWVGYWLRTTADNLEVGIMIDDDVSTTPGAAGNNHEISHFLPVIADGEWHLYEFELANPETWQDGGFATSPNATGPTGEINDAVVTIDSLVFRGAWGIIDVNEVEFFVDEVAYNPNGPLSSVQMDDTPLAITSLGYDPNTLTITIEFTSSPQQRYTIESSTSLAEAGRPGGWQPVAAVEAEGPVTRYEWKTAAEGQEPPPVLFVRVARE